MPSILRLASTIHKCPDFFPEMSGNLDTKIPTFCSSAPLFESFLAKFLISDMKPYKEPSQCGNEKGLSIARYRVKMIHTILTAVDDNTIHEAKIVIAQLIDWQGAFDRQCHRLGVEAFLENGPENLSYNYF